MQSGILATIISIIVIPHVIQHHFLNVDAGELGLRLVFFGVFLFSISAYKSIKMQLHCNNLLHIHNIAVCNLASIAA